MINFFSFFIRLSLELLAIAVVSKLLLWASEMVGYYYHALSR